MKNTKIGIIVTVYNKEAQIAECLSSVRQQSYKDIEVIVIDDGSVDRSGTICQTFCEKDKRFQYFYKENGGVSSARNYGLHKFKGGEYVVFIDGDDFIDANYIERLLQYKKYDLVISGFRKIKNGKEIEDIQPKNQVISQGNLEEYLFNEQSFQYVGVPYTKLFKFSIIKKHHILFDENVTLGEDVIFNFTYMKYCNEIKVISFVGYNNSIIPNTLSRKNYKNFWKMNISFINNLDDVFHYKYENYWAFMYMRSVLIVLATESCRFKAFKNAWKNVIEDKEFNKLDLVKIYNRKQKIVYFLLKHNLMYSTYIFYKLKHVF